MVYNRNRKNKELESEIYEKDWYKIMKLVEMNLMKLDLKCRIGYREKKLIELSEMNMNRKRKWAWNEMREQSKIDQK